jgi:hypothetical protein
VTFRSASTASSRTEGESRQPMPLTRGTALRAEQHAGPLRVLIGRTTR